MTKNTATPHPFDALKQREASQQAKLFAKHPFWWLSVAGRKTDLLFDAKSKLLWQLLPEDPEEKETHAILGRDFRTLTQGVDQWEYYRRSINETTLTDIPKGWRLVSTKRTESVAKNANFGADYLASIDGKMYYSRSHHNGSYHSGSRIEVNKNQVRATITECVVLLEKNGVENLPISTDFEDYKLRKKDFAYLSPLGLSDWKLPSEQQLKDLVLLTNPYRAGEGLALQNWAYWRCETGNLIIGVNEKGKPELSNDSYVVNARELVLNTTWQNKTPEQIVLELLEKGWVLIAHEAETTIAPASVMDMLKEMDYRSVRLPRLEDAQFSDVSKGIWEFCGMDEARLKSEGIIARNPELDVKTFNVAIDFGTSSTVVAINENGKPKLLRIGAKDFFEAAKPSHYENPTVLEFKDYTDFLSAWQSKAYRPEVRWDSVRASHEAQNNFRDNQGDANVVASILPKMKQWALRQSEDMRVKIIDSQGVDFELPPLRPTNPIKGQLLTVSNQDAFDPIELYAWFLGMHINWRERGLFVKYYMTFPVDYPKEIKESILASFRRGLHRSMPESFARSDKFQQQFSLKELATEPAAYAASALDIFQIQPTAEGVAYSVFDFGGGTTDFDYGYYRTATSEEEDMGIERVLEHIGKQGDRFLGGENLLENLAFITFNDNIDVCRSNKIAFTRPLDATAIAGTELLIDKTKAAQTNSILLMAKLRSFWETGAYKAATGGVESLELLNRDGNKVRCELKIDVTILDEYLRQRIEKGITNFFIGIQHTFAQSMPNRVHILLAGNSSRSKWVKDYFAGDTYQAMLTQLFGETLPEFIIHNPLEADEKDLYRPTAKTGVALGLLKLCRGDLKSLNKVQETPGQAAFNHFVGRIRKGKFQHTLKRNDGYNRWHELAAINEEGTVYLFHTQSLLALGNDMSSEDAELNERRIDFVGDTTGHRAFIRAIDPNTVELCSAESIQHLEKGEYENLQPLKLG